jgi:hypothetical protein
MKIVTEKKVTVPGARRSTTSVSKVMALSAVFGAVLGAINGAAGQQPEPATNPPQTQWALPSAQQDEIDTGTPAPVAAQPVAAPAPQPEASAPTATEDVRAQTEAAKPAPASAPVAPAPALTSEATGERAERSWFTRPSLTATFGDGPERWELTLFGFAQADLMVDSTRSYEDAMGSSLVARDDTFDGRSARTQFSVRNSRIGLSFVSPTFGGVKASAVLVGDFFGNQPGTPASASSSSETTVDHPVSENAFFNNPTFRLRHAYLKLQNDYVDVLAGQTYDIFGWQNTFFPCSVQYLGLPNQLFSRNAQLQLSRSFGARSALGVDVAAAAVRPAQRNSAIPDANAGIRFNANGWKGITTPGNTGTIAAPASIGVSGTLRSFKVNAFTPPPTQSANAVTGWGVSIDALLPVIPAKSADDRGNRLTLNGSFVTGSGIADLITAGGGATFPTLPNPAQANPPPLYSADVDYGLVSFDTKGIVHTIDWWAFRAGIQYYLPPRGRLILSANYTRAHSKNLSELFPKGGAEIELLVRVADTSQYADFNLFYDLTPAVRLGLSGQYTKVQYLDGENPHNLRAMAQAVYAF